MRASRLFLAILAISVAAPAAGPGAIIFAHGAWAAVDRGTTCVALGRSDRIAAKGKVQATAGFSFTPDHRRWGEFHAHLRRMPRAGASVMANVGGQLFLLDARGDWAWSRDGTQAQAIITAVRSAEALTIESHDQAGSRFIDPYVLDGAPTAIDAAAARCALRGAGKIQ